MSIKENLLKSCLSKNNQQRSFVIPVLDYSPASNLNINVLLEDLTSIEGEVIVIFNNVEIAEELKNHPRIDFYSIMSKNIGVSRAWNVGLNISQTPVTFICNSDLHITKQSVEKLEFGLNIEDAAMVGPQGSRFSFEEMRDLVYFGKGMCDRPIVVDAVSGFYFAVKTNYFKEGLLKFENSFTPCYFEEWDIGLQIKKMGLNQHFVNGKIKL